MKNYYRTISNFVLGICDITKEKYIPVIQKIQERGDAKYKENKLKGDNDFSAKVGSICDDKLSNMDFVKKDELEALQDRIAVLEKYNKS